VKDRACGSRTVTSCKHKKTAKNFVREKRRPGSLIREIVGLSEQGGDWRFRPKKRLGQNFLIDNNIQRKIISACQVSQQDTVLEIGAGRGELTRLLAQQTEKLTALEVDAYLYSMLKNNLAASPGVRIINQDILDFNIARHFKGIAKIKVVGNLPYNITTPIIVHLLKFSDKIGDIFITVQKEFARRMAASCGSSDWGAFSCFVQYYTEPRILFLIKKTCFRPQPKVDSALVKLSIKQNLPLEKKKEKRLFRIIRLSFQQRRKVLRNALSGIISAKKLSSFLAQYGFDRNIRAEQLSLQDFINLATA
jgi:16S rRNA (adenine1518-N6/adenine1519-N6)-dimethyltransferase